MQKRKCSSCIAPVNRAMANIDHLQSHILSEIFKTHCCTYGSALQYFNPEGFLEKNA